MNALEEFEIYKVYNYADTKPHVLNDQLHFKSNILYDTASVSYTHLIIIINFKWSQILRFP